MAGQINMGKATSLEVFTKVADAIASVDMDQEDREAVAAAVVAAFQETRLAPFLNHPETIQLLASDPLVPCAGYDLPAGEHFDCPTGTIIRQAMHLRSAPDGRSAIWARRAPYGEIRCVSCGAMQFNPVYRDNVLAAAASVTRAVRARAGKD